MEMSTLSLPAADFCRCGENALVKLCFKELGHLGFISLETLLLYKQKTTKKNLIHSSMEDHTILKEIPEFKSSVSRLLGKVDASRLFWWVVHNFCVKYCTVVPCESLSTDAESETAVSVQRLSDQKEKGRCTQHPINKTITLFQFHLITEYNQKKLQAAITSCEQLLFENCWCILLR